MQRSPWLLEWKEPAGERDVPGVDRSQADVNLKFQFQRGPETPFKQLRSAAESISREQ
jgi:hypothetical protein